MYIFSLLNLHTKQNYLRQRTVLLAKTMHFIIQVSRLDGSLEFTIADNMRRAEASYVLESFGRI